MPGQMFGTTMPVPGGIRLWMTTSTPQRQCSDWPGPIARTISRTSPASACATLLIARSCPRKLPM
eukprot:7833653-Pyramimonas_sp.AAC.1